MNYTILINPFPLQLPGLVKPTAANPQPAAPRLSDRTFAVLRRAMGQMDSLSDINTGIAYNLAQYPKMGDNPGSGYNIALFPKDMHYFRREEVTQETMNATMPNVPKDSLGYRVTPDGLIAAITPAAVFAKIPLPQLETRILELVDPHGLIRSQLDPTASLPV